MNPRGFLAKHKTHLIFVGAFLFALAVSIAMNLAANQTFGDATWTAISEIRPMDYFMFALFWYACAVYRPQEWSSPLISLNLSRSNNPK